MKKSNLIFLFIKILIVWTLVQACAPRRDFVDEWPEFQFDSQRNGFVSDGPRPPLELFWKFKTEGRILYSPVIKDSALYFGSRDGYLYSLSTEDGGVLWKKELIGKQGQFGSIGQGGAFESPSIIEDKVFVGKWSPYFYVFGWELASGEQLWKQYSGELLNRSPWVIADSEAIYFNADPPLQPGVREVKPKINFKAFGQNPQSELWNQTLPGLLKAAPAHTEQLIFIPLSGEPSWIYALHKDNGEVKWRYKLTGQLKSSPLVKDNTVYLVSDRGHLHAINVNNGKLIWRFPFKNSSIVKSIAYGDNKLYIADAKNTLYAFDLNNLEILWKYRTYRPISTPIATHDFVYFGGGNKQLTIIDAHRGTYKWSFRTKGEIVGSPAIYKDMIFIGSSDGYLYAFKEKKITKK